MEILGRVTDSDGEPVRDAVVMIVSATASHPDIAALTDEQGNYRLSGLAPGIYRVGVNAEQRAPSSSEVRLNSEEGAQLDFKLSD
ncbi:MAG TPA: carboxypeptidase-like regulatory domain-containing protein [Chloroflexia bacterium]|jgi:protocatechuate 3,4-dioxygenase beta subunit